MEDIVFELIDDHVCSADMYTYKGSIWMIFTDEKKWIIELTKEGTLWYNYYFFRNLFKYVSMDDIEYQDYITKWVEKTIQNGIKHTRNSNTHNIFVVENTLQNGVKHTISEINQDILWVEKTIQDGVKYTQVNWGVEENRVEDTLQNGVKHTDAVQVARYDVVEDTLQNGIRHTNLEMNHQPMTVLRVIEDGIKTTYPEYNDMSERAETVVKTMHNVRWRRDGIEENVIQNGVKKTISGHPDKIEFLEKVVLEYGVKETWGYDKQSKVRVDNVLEYGVKDTVGLKSDLKATVDIIVDNSK